MSEELVNQGLGYELDDLIDVLEDVLTDYHTWLAEALRDHREGIEDVEALRDLCSEILEARTKEAGA